MSLLIYLLFYIFFSIFFFPPPLPPSLPELPPLRRRGERGRAEPSAHPPSGGGGAGKRRRVEGGGGEEGKASARLAATGTRNHQYPLSFSAAGCGACSSFPGGCPVPRITGSHVSPVAGPAAAARFRCRRPPPPAAAGRGEPGPFLAGICSVSCRDLVSFARNLVDFSRERGGFTLLPGEPPRRGKASPPPSPLHSRGSPPVLPALVAPSPPPLSGPFGGKVAVEGVGGDGGGTDTHLSLEAPGVALRVVASGARGGGRDIQRQRMASATLKRLGVAAEVGGHWPPGFRLVGGSSPPRCCPRVGRNAASRLTLTITLGEEKALGCYEYFLPGP